MFLKLTQNNAAALWNPNFWKNFAEFRLKFRVFLLWIHYDSYIGIFRPFGTISEVFEKSSAEHSAEDSVIPCFPESACRLGFGRELLALPPLARDNKFQLESPPAKTSQATKHYWFHARSVECHWLHLTSWMVHQSEVGWHNSNQSFSQYKSRTRQPFWPSVMLLYVHTTLNPVSLVQVSCGVIVAHCVLSLDIGL